MPDFDVPACPQCGSGPIVPGRAGKLQCVACGMIDVATCCDGAPSGG